MDETRMANVLELFDVHDIKLPQYESECSWECRQLVPVPSDVLMVTV